MLGAGGQGQGWPRPAGVRLDGVFDGRSRFGNGCDANEMTYSVPAEKCGLVIGKGWCVCAHLFVSFYKFLALMIENFKILHYHNMCYSTEL